MKIIIFGATGSVGQHLTRQALAAGYSVTAFVRDTSKIKFEHENLNIVKGDVMSPDSVRQAIPHHDAVMIALGAGRKGGIRAAGTANIIAAMHEHGIQRLICQSTLGAGDSRGNLNFLWKYIMFGLLLRPAYADHQLQEQYVQMSGLDWTIVRPGAFTDGEHTGNYRHGFSKDDKSTALKISRADVADFLLRQIKDTAYLKQSPGLSY